MNGRRRIRPPVAGALAAAALAATVASCRSPSLPTADRPLAPESPPEIVVSMREYRYEFEPGTSLPAGRVVFRMVNVGQERHNPALLPLDPRLPPIDQQVRGSQREVVTPFAGVNDRLPGAAGTFAVDLLPGRRYAFVCFASTPDGVAHSQMGMTWEGWTPVTATAGVRVPPR